MRVLEPGHCYKLNILDGNAIFGVVDQLVFVKRVGEKYPGNKPSSHPGTTSQEVLRVLIDRAGYVNRQIPCWQTWLGRKFMKWTVWLFEHRAAKRHNRKPPSLFASVYGETCSKCGHVGCWERCR